MSIGFGGPSMGFISPGGVGGPVSASDVVVDDTIGRTGSTDLQGYLDTSRTTIGPVHLAWEPTDFPDAVLGVRTIVDPTLLLADVTDPAAVFVVEAPVVGLGVTISALRGNSAGPGPAVSSVGQPSAEFARLSIGNISTDPGAVGIRIDSADFLKIHDALIVPASIGVQLESVALGDVSDVGVLAGAQGIQITGTTGALGLEISSAEPDGSNTPAAYNAISVAGTVGEVIIELDAAGVGGPTVPAGYGIFIDPAVTAPSSSIVVRSSTGTPGELLRPTGLMGTDARVFVTASKPDRNTTSIGGIEYNDAADELLVAVAGPGGGPWVGSLPSESPLAVLVSPRATMENWEIDTIDPAEAVFRYTGLESILGRFSWNVILEKNGGGTDFVTVSIEKITGGPTTIPDTPLRVPVSAPPAQEQRAGGTIQILQNDEFRVRFSNESTSTGILVSFVDIEVLRV